MHQPSNSSAALDGDPTIEFACSVADGLASQPKQLPTKYLYDALGSQLFEAICELPWYKITRGEHALLAEHANTIMAGAGPYSRIVELGSGSGAKLSVLLSAVKTCKTDVHLVDISGAALAQSVQALSRHSSVTLIPHCTSYEAGLNDALNHAQDDGRALILFLGSNIGNLTLSEAELFLHQLRVQFRRGDQLLLGADLIKPAPELVLAYDDPLGVTSAFNKNLLARLNRELDADFDLNLFSHRALWNAQDSRIEVYLESQADQLVCIRGAGCCVQFTQNELIWTESAHKYETHGIIAMGQRAGFTSRTQWIEPESKFALTLFEAEP